MSFESRRRAAGYRGAPVAAPAADPVFGSVVEVVDYSTNNAWGFGGSNGKETRFASGWAHRKGTLCYRHAYRGLPTKTEYWLSPWGGKVFSHAEAVKIFSESR